MSTDAMKQALEQTLEMLNDNREYIEANERSEYLAMYDKAIAGAEKALADQPAPVQQEPVVWVPYLSDRADGVSGHYAIARWNPRGYREVWNLRRHAWGAYSDDVLSLEEADTLLRLIEIPTRKVETPQPAQQEPVAGEGKRLSERLKLCARNVAFVAAGRVDMSSAAMQEMFALIDHVCVGLDSPQAQPAREPLTDGQKYAMYQRYDLESVERFWYEQGVEYTEAAHGIKEENT